MFNSFVSFAVEMLNNGMLLSPPINNGAQGAGASGNNNNGGGSSSSSSVGAGRRENGIQITQPPSSPLESPLPSPLSVNSSASLPSSNIGLPVSSFTSTSTDTLDPNWQSKKSTVRERNASMFNNELMSDVLFVVGTDCKYLRNPPNW